MIKRFTLYVDLVRTFFSGANEPISGNSLSVVSRLFFFQILFCEEKVLLYVILFFLCTTYARIINSIQHYLINFSSSIIDCFLFESFWCCSIICATFCNAFDNCSKLLLPLLVDCFNSPIFSSIVRNFSSKFIFKLVFYTFPPEMWYMLSKCPVSNIWIHRWKVLYNENLILNLEQNFDSY